jgi:hypothetical protein
MWLDRLRIVEVSYCDPHTDGSHPLPSGGSCEEDAHRLANGGYTHRSHPLPSGGSCEENLHRLANGGYGRTVATGERWLRVNGGYG